MVLERTAMPQYPPLATTASPVPEGRLIVIFRLPESALLGPVPGSHSSLIQALPWVKAGQDSRLWWSVLNARFRTISGYSPPS